MERIVFGIGAIVALIMIFRYATKKVSGIGQNASRSGVVIGYVAGAPGVRAKQKRATFATLIGVNVICMLGLIAAIIAAMRIEEMLLGLLLILGSLIFFPAIAVKFLESQDRDSSFSLFGTLAVFCILFWVCGSMWYFEDIVVFIKGVFGE